MRIYKTAKSTTYTVAISKFYFSREFWPTNEHLGSDIYELIKVKAENRTDAAQQVWASKQGEWEPKMIPPSKLGRKVSLYVDDPTGVSQGTLTRLPPVRVL